MIPSHECSIYCRGDEHCDLVYSADHTDQRLLKYSVARAYEDRYGMHVVRLEEAKEAPDLATFPLERRVTLSGDGSADARRWLVFWRDEPPPTHGGRRPNTGGKRTGAGRKHLATTRVRISTTLAQETDQRIRTAKQKGETYGQTVDRLLERNP